MDQVPLRTAIQLHFPVSLRHVREEVLVPEHELLLSAVHLDDYPDPFIIQIGFELESTGPERKLNLHRCP